MAVLLRIKLKFFYLGALFLFIGGIGYSLSLNCLGWAILVALIFLVVNFMLQKPKKLYLIDMWLLGFIYFFSGEYFFIEALTKEFEHDLLVAVQALITSAFGATIIGYAVFVKYKRNNRYCYVNQRMSEKRPLPISFLIAWLSFSLLVIIQIFFVLTPEQLIFAARHQRTTAIDIGTLTPYLNSFLISLPLISGYLMSKFRLTFMWNVLFVTMTAICIITTYFIGTRFYLGYVLFGLLFFYLKGLNNIKKKHMAALLIFALILLFSQALMSVTRLQGQGIIKEIAVNDISSRILSIEGILKINSLILLTKPYRDTYKPNEHLFLLVWWIPRTIWPEKPTMGEYWFIRKYTSEKDFGKGHSVSGSFIMPAILDFGPIGAIIFSLFYGMGIAFLERFSERFRTQLTMPSTIVSLLFFGVAFMVRSLQTSLIFMSIVTIPIVPLIIIERKGLQLGKKKFLRNVNLS